MQPVRWHDAAAIDARTRALQLAIVVGVSAILIFVAGGLMLRDGSLRFAVTADALVIDVDPGILASRWRAPLDAIVDVQLASAPLGRRLRGTGKPGHCSGWFVREGLGRVRDASTCGDEVVVVRLPDETWTLAAADREGLARAIRTRSPAVFDAPASPPPPTWWRAMQGLMLALLAVPLLMLAAVLMPLRYAVAGGELRVRSPFGTRRFEVSGAAARIAEQPRVGWRVLGMGLPGAWLGIYRVDGEKTHLWASRRGGPAVIVEGARRVMVTPADPPALLEDLRAAGAR